MLYLKFSQQKTIDCRIISYFSISSIHIYLYTRNRPFSFIISRVSLSYTYSPNSFYSRVSLFIHIWIPYNPTLPASHNSHHFSFPLKSKFCSLRSVEYCIPWAPASANGRPMRRISSFFSSFSLSSFLARQKYDINMRYKNSRERRARVDGVYIIARAATDGGDGIDFEKEEKRHNLYYYAEKMSEWIL